MIEFLRSWVVNIVIIIIFVTITDIMLPEGNVKKYVQVIIGTFVLLVIIKPFISAKDIQYDFESSYKSASVIINGEEDMRNIEVLSKYRKAKALNMYEIKLKEQIAAAVSYRASIDKNSVKVILDINKDQENSEFGMLNSVQIIIPDKVEKSQIEKVKKVEIGKEENVIYKEEKEYNFNEKTSSDDIKDVLSKMLGIDRDKIQIKLSVERD